MPGARPPTWVGDGPKARRARSSWGEWPDEYAGQWEEAAYLAGGMEQPEPYSDPAHWSEEEGQYDATSWEEPVAFTADEWGS